MRTRTPLALLLACVVVTGARAAEPIRGTFALASASACPSAQGLCATWQLLATADGDAWVEIRTDAPVRLAQLPSWRTEAAPDGVTTRYTFPVKQGDRVTLPLRAIVAPRADVGYTLTLSPELEVASAPRPPSPSRVDWDAEHARRMKAAPGTDFSRPMRELAEDEKPFAADAWVEVDRRSGAFDGPFGVDFEGSPDRCYRVVLHLKGAWTPEMRRAGHVKVVTPSGERSDVFARFYSQAVTATAHCPKVAGPVRLVMQADHRAEAPWAGQVATGTWTAVVMAKPSSPFGYDRKGFETLVATETKGFEKVATLGSGPLEQLGPVEWLAGPKKCYVAVLRFGEGARWADETRKGHVTFAATLAGLDVSAGPGVRGPGAVGVLGCFAHARPGTLEVRGVGSGGGPLGTGPATLELWQRAMPAGELAELNRELRAQRRTMQDLTEEVEGDVCAWCAERRALCDDQGGGTCQADFTRCLARASVPATRCGL